MLVAVNECDFPELNDCHVNATCVDTFGSFSCTCNPGYAGNGTQCSSKPVPATYTTHTTSLADVNECEDEETNSCDANSSCMDTVGSFDCVCNTGYTGNGFVCLGKQGSALHAFVT